MPEKSPRVIYTASEAITALGDGDISAGVKFVANMFSIGENAVRNWCSPKRLGIPPEAYSKLAPRLRAKGLEFDDALFQQYPAVFKPKPPTPTTKRKPRRKNGKRK